MGEGEALLAGIIANPADTTARLVYADWLDDHGQAERAWFVRFQCDPRNQGSHNGEREYDTLDRHLYDWLDFRRLTGRKRNRRYHDYYLSDYGPPNVVFYFGRRDPVTHNRSRVELEIRRGFISGVTAPLSWWRAHGGAIRASHPLETVAIETASGSRLIQLTPRPYLGAES